jgi:excinuclease ABC subunit C
MFNIKEELGKLPDSPGVYMMKDDMENIIYVGKAKSLKKRVKQYFQSSGHSLKIGKMISKIESFEYIITDNEIEALILESNLIKKNRPKYNTLLMDDKHYPYIKVTVREDFPRIIKVRKIQKDKNKYFGPYVSTYSVNKTIEALRDIFKIRTCKINIKNGNERKRPCLNYYIKRCDAPCVGNINKEDYRKMIDEALDILDGKEDKIIKILEEKMLKASKELKFELAAEYRDKIESIRNVNEKQKITSTKLVDLDVVGMALGEDKAVVEIFFVRNGKVQGKEDYILQYNGEEKQEVIESFIKQFYAGSVYVPREIYLQEEIPDKELIEKWLGDKRGGKIEIKVPLKGEKNMLLKMVRKNAFEKLHKNFDKIKKKTEDSREAVEELEKLLDFDKSIDRIEAFDISNIQGVENVGSMVVFIDGLPKKSDYRRFRIKTVYGPNDYKSMEEMLDRRISRGLKEKAKVIKGKSFDKLPDLILMDGGKGQVNIAEEVLYNYGVDIPVCGMVKDDKHTTRGLIYNNKEFEIKKNSKVYRLISSIQNEAHRFAITYHKNLRSKNAFKSELDDIPGIGEKRKLNLLKKFKSVEKIKEATYEELLETEGMNKKVAEEVVRFFGN